MLAWPLMRRYGYSGGRATGRTGGGAMQGAGR
jgi:hypothetical protein